MGLDWQNNNFAPESHFFCTFLCCHCSTTTWKCQISPFLDDVKKRQQFSFFFPKLLFQPLRIQLQKKCQHLKNWTKWNKRDKFWSSTTLLFKWRFCSRLRRRCSKLMLHGTICNNDFQRNTALRHCCNILLNGRNIVPILQRFVAQNIVVANRPM